MIQGQKEGAKEGAHVHETNHAYENQAISQESGFTLPLVHSHRTMKDVLLPMLKLLPTITLP